MSRLIGDVTTGKGVPAALEHFPIKWMPVDRRKCDKNKRIERPT